MGGRPEGGADRCGPMHYATTSGIGSRIFCPAEKAMWEALRRTIECSSKPFCTDIEPAFLLPPGNLRKLHSRSLPRVRLRKLDPRLLALARSERSRNELAEAN